MTTTAHDKAWARQTAGHSSRRLRRTPPPSDLSTSPPGRSSRLTRFLRGADDDPNWARPGLFALLTLAAVVYCWDLTNSGYANEFYAAAVKSGAQDWKAWLFGSLDSSNAITVDKPPASLWVMGLSARLFGFSSFSLLLPQALMGVGTVALTYGAVRRWSGHAAGLLAGLLVTLTPVAALMFRFDNPDAMLVLLMTAAAYTVVRAVDAGRRDEAAARTALSWMIGAGLLIGLAFLTKMLQGLLVLPGLGLAYLVAARFSLRTRIMHLVAATASVVVGAGWFVALVALWPAGSRPYIGGSTNNSEWELALGYNGLGRILGGSGNAGGMGGGGGGFGGTPGLLRMVNSQFGGEVSWLLPAALILLVAGFVARGRAPRTDVARAALVLWGGWLIVTALCLSFMEGTVHSYYSVALVPAIAGCLAVGAREAHARRAALGWRCVTAAAICVTAVWSFRLLTTNAPHWLTWFRWTSVVVAVVGAVLFTAAPAWGDRARRLTTVALVIGVLGGLGGTSAYTFATLTTGHTGSMPAAGPSTAGGAMGGGSARSAGGSSSGQHEAPSGARTGATPQARQSSDEAPTSGTQHGGAAGNATTSRTSAASANGTTPGGQGSGSNDAALTKLLRSTHSRWSAAVIGDQTAAGYILDSSTAVMSIGGWSGTDANITLAQFQQHVKNGDITYFIAGGGMGGGPGGNSGASAQITAWVKAHYKATTVGGTTVYDLTQRTS